MAETAVHIAAANGHAEAIRCFSITLTLFMLLLIIIA